jgi:hypothetical protein
MIFWFFCELSLAKTRAGSKKTLQSYGFLIDCRNLSALIYKNKSKKAFARLGSSPTAS